MRMLKWIGVTFGCALVVACGASGASSTGFSNDDAGGGEPVDEAGVSGPVDSGKAPSKPVDAGATNSGVVIDAGPSGNPVGFPCAHPTDCTSGLCEPVVAGSGSVCISTCATQADCTDNFFCDPISGADAGAGGYCVPHSPSHCAVCGVDDDCGSLSEVCGVAAGDTAKACHIDCTLAPAAGSTSACPPEYNCVSTTIDGNARKLCMPKAPITNCTDALGGYCDRISTPQACARTDAQAGICVGYRDCSASSNRYGSCGASSPVCKACGVSNPTGCTENLCTNAAQSVNNCGTCGNSCAGQGQVGDIVTCATSTSPASCTFACSGENYDVNNSPADGCEASDPVNGNHASNTPSGAGSYPCDDGSSNPNISGHLPSDLRGARTSPAVAGFDSTSGSAPDWYSIGANGGTFCVNDITMTLQMSGSSHPACYHMHVTTDKHTYDCDTNASGTCSAGSGSSGQYNGGTNIIIVVSKSDALGCAATDDNPTYTVTGHL
ncbi:MAG: hypothetical protein ABI461_22575 [Polyangiaceae bacterium]